MRLSRITDEILGVSRTATQLWNTPLYLDLCITIMQGLKVPPGTLNQPLTQLRTRETRKNASSLFASLVVLPVAYSL